MSILLEAWETVLFVHTIITQIQTNLDFNLIHLKTALNMLTKVPTCQLKHQLFRNMSHNLKNVGKNCIIMINQIKDKCHTVKKQIKQFISTLIDRLGLQNASFSIHKAINIMLKIAEIVFLGETMINKPVQDNSHYVEEHELINYLMLFQIHWNNLILLISSIALRINFTFNEQIDAMIKQTSFKDSTEQIFIIELIKPELIKIYDELCALCIIFRIYLDVSDKFFLIDSHQNNDEDNRFINNWETQINLIQMQVKLFIQECQIKYTSIFQQQQIQFNQLINIL